MRLTAAPEQAADRAREGVRRIRAADNGGPDSMKEPLRQKPIVAAEDPVVLTVVKAADPEGEDPDWTHLMTRVSQDDQAAHTRFVNLTWHPLVRFLASLVRARGLHGQRSLQFVEDAVQETHIRVWLNRAQFDPARGTGRAWLYKIARFRLIDRFRKEGIEWGPSLGENADEEQPGFEAPDPCPSPADAVEQQDSADALLANLLAGLNSDERELFAFHWLLDFDYERISSITGIPKSALGSRIFRLKEKLERIADELDTEHDTNE